MVNAEAAATEESVVPAPADAAKIAELRRKARKWRRLSYLGTYTNMLAIAVMSLSFLVAKSSYILAQGFLICVMSALSIVGGGLANMARGHRNKAIAELTKGANVSLIAPLIDELDLKMTSDAVPMALTVLLPRLQTTDAPLLKARHHRRLNAVLACQKWRKSEAYTSFLSAILKAYEQVGDMEDLPVVERLASGAGYAKKDKRIAEAAQACLPYLQARAEQQEARQNLLRASSASADNGETLLRPAYGANNTDPSQLLRAAGLDAGNGTDRNG